VDRCSGFQTKVELLAEGFEIYGFGDTGIAASLKDALVVGEHGVSRDGNDRNMGQGLALSDPLGQQEAILAAELNVEKNGVGQFHLEGGVALFESFGIDDFEAFRFLPWPGGPDHRRDAAFGWSLL